MIISITKQCFALTCTSINKIPKINTPLIEMIESENGSEYLKLKDLFYSPKTGFTNVNDLITNEKKHKIALSALDIIRWYQDQPVNQQYKHERSQNINPPNIPFTAEYPGRIIAD